MTEHGTHPYVLVVSAYPDSGVNGGGTGYPNYNPPGVHSTTAPEGLHMTAAHAVPHSTHESNNHKPDGPEPH